jgi:hypothetical protein
MEGLHRRRQSPLPLHREFAGSRLEEQILKRVFELVLPACRLDRAAYELPKAEADQPQAHPFRSQGA